MSSSTVTFLVLAAIAVALVALLVHTVKDAIELGKKDDTPDEY